MTELAGCLAAQPDELDAAPTHRDDMAFWLYSSRLDRQAEGGGAPAARHRRTPARPTPRACSAYARTTSRSRRRSSSTPTGWATTSRSRTGSARTTVLHAGAAQAASAILDTMRRAPADAVLQRARRSTARSSTSRRRRARPELGAHLRLGRRAARRREICGAGRTLRPRHRRRHRLHRDAAHLLLQPARRRAAGHERQAGARATSCSSSTTTAPVARRPGDRGLYRCRATPRRPTTGTSTRRPRRRCSGDWFFTGDRYRATRTATTSTRAAPTT